MTRAVLQLVLSLPLVGVFAMFALGIVTIHRASRVLNLAHGAMAMLPAYVTYALARAGAPIALAFIGGVAFGAALGAAVERLVLRRLRGASETTQTVGTVAVLGLLIALAARIWGTAPLRAPGVFPDHTFRIGRSVLQGGEIGLFCVALIVTAACLFLFGRTDLGLAMRGAAENPRAAALMGADPLMLATVAWALGGALAACAGILLAATTNLHPYTLSLQVLPAFVAALIGGLSDLRGALIGAVVVGVATGIVPALGPFGEQAGAPQLVLAIVALVVMAARGSRLVSSDVRAHVSSDTSTGTVAMPFWSKAAGAALLLALPWLPIADSVRADASLAAMYTIVAVSLVILTGWVGQISLAHATFVGIAAFAAGALARAGVPFPLNLPFAAAVSGLAAAGLGVIALRVRGLYLAVATLIFGWMADAWLFKQPWVSGEGGSSTIPARPLGRAGGFPSFDFTSPRTFYYVALAGAALAVFVAANLRDSRTGRALASVRGSETAAASIGIDVTRAKLLAFAISGALAGVAGTLFMLDQRTARADQFDLTQSLFFLSMAVVGGLARLGGAVTAGIIFAGVYEVFFRVRALDGYLPMFSSGLLLLMLLVSPGGIAGMAGRARRARPDTPRAPSPVQRSTMADARAPGGAVILGVAGITVRFGGLVAAEDVSLEVRDGEIVGLIGPNGAGKTTVFNSISGMNQPAAGRIHLFGEDVTALPPHERARRGLGRTFQAIQLFRDMTVEDNLLAAAFVHGRAGVIPQLFVGARALTDETEARERVRAALAMTEIDAVATARVADLPFGVLRRVEVARTIVAGARVVMLDEPASGLDDRETDELGDLLSRLRAEHGMSLLLIEHDVRFVTALSHRMWVLDRGRILAQGTPSEIRTHPAVIAAYLGGAAPEPVAIH